MNLSGAHRWEVAEFVAVHKPAHTYREIAALVAAQWNGGTVSAWLDQSDTRKVA